MVLTDKVEANNEQESFLSDLGEHLQELYDLPEGSIKHHKSGNALHSYLSFDRAALDFPGSNDEISRHLLEDAYDFTTQHYSRALTGSVEETRYGLMFDLSFEGFSRMGINPEVSMLCEDIRLGFGNGPF